MSDKLSVEVYRDAKRIFKWVIIASVALAALAFALMYASHFYSERKYNEINEEILKKAEAAVQGKTAFTFKRDSLGEKSSISVWILADSDRHIVVEKNGEKSLFTSRIAEYDGIIAYHVAGKSCSSLYFETKKEFITSVSCNGDKYFTPK